MSPATNSSSRSSPYARRPTANPKSSRQQFSACGACRMRRVRCDLKDLTVETAGPNPACSNCKERGLKCVDEFADVKAVKLLRRGRRLQQVEQIYGKVTDPDHPNGSSSSLQSRQRTIPHLQPEFFSSPFWRWFSTQRPVFDANEFPPRFLAHTRGSQTLGPEGQLLAMLLVVWAYSYGVNEYGREDTSDQDFIAFSSSQPDLTAPPTAHPRLARRPSLNISPERDLVREASLDRARRARRTRTDEMLCELLDFVDTNAIMRRPTWDGVRVLLLVLPLMEEANVLDKITMYEAALSQAHSLCKLSASNATASFGHASDDALVRTRVFWYAHVQEGIATGLRGGRLILDDDDLDAIQRDLSSFGADDLRGSPSGYVHPNHMYSLPLRVSAVCRRVHSVLTGAKATRAQEAGAGIDALGIRDAWDGLDACWEEFEALRCKGVSVTDEGVDVDRFVSAWQIFIFEAHNTIRETLKGRAATLVRKSLSPPPTMYGAAAANGSSRPSSHHSSASPSSNSFSSVQSLHALAAHRCARLLPAVLRIVKSHVRRGEREEQHGAGSALFRWDTGLVRDGVFFAAYLAAGGEADVIGSEATLVTGDASVTMANGLDDGVADADEGVDYCVQALASMRWAFSKSEDREETVRMIWENRKQMVMQQHHHAALGMNGYHHHQHQQHHHQQQQHQFYVSSKSALPAPSAMHAGLPLSSLTARPALPPLSLALSSPSRGASFAESAPSTAGTTDGVPTGWPSYSPPGTSASATPSTGSAGFSGADSPVFSPGVVVTPSSASSGTPGVGVLKAEGGHDDAFYHLAAAADMDSQFSFNAPGGVVGAEVYHPGTRPHSQHQQHAAPGSAHGYLDAAGAYMGAGGLGEDIGVTFGGEEVAAFY
ncbi:hypothetical protein HGRIS_013511 [Hohenbuehelia grisea]|uniref:Zn(2)-C6 fungal-type domain-containing protein n=1 Tax=Hohenbuehelia grisea TaxID=104357 RepID=A0ABR3IVX0_9AGAR